LIVSSSVIRSFNFKHSFNDNDSVVTWHFGSDIHHKNKSLHFNIQIFSPTTPGNYSLIYFLTGLDGIVATSFYRDFSTLLSLETRSIVVAYDSFRIPPPFPDKEENWFQVTLEWTIANVNALFNDKSTPIQIRGHVFPDVKTYGVSLMSHSASGHPIVSYLNKTCGLVTNAILLDPVDGYDPFGLVKIFITHPPTKLPFETPILLATTGLANVPRFKGLPPCAPKNLSNIRFYDSLAGPIWNLNFTDYGHVDFFDENVILFLIDMIIKLINY
jgi:hypothetical protein